MISGRDILYISSIDWNFVWHGPQEIAKRFAEAGNRVLYVENLGVRAPSVRDVGRVGSRLRHWASSFASGGLREVAPNVFACAPLVLPPFGPRWRREANRRLFLRPIERAVRALGMRDPLIWTYLPTDAALHLIKSVRGPGSSVAYYCISDFVELTQHTPQVRQSEAETVALCDVVFANCTALAERFQQWNENVHVFPVGVDLEAFPFEIASTESATAGNGHGGPVSALPLSNLKRPVIGYVGGLHKHVDFGMLGEMARARPAWSWVFVGPVQANVGELAGLPNVQILGQREHRELVHYIRGFDVGIVPYVNSDYTMTVVPTKINEYLAVGKPVVSTELPTVMEFNRRYDVLLTAPARAAAFLNAIERALELPQDRGAGEARRGVAALGEWGVRFTEMNRLIEEAEKNRGAA